jgi:hypothetical protein
MRCSLVRMDRALKIEEVLRQLIVHCRWQIDIQSVSQPQQETALYIYKYFASQSLLKTSVTIL